MSFSTYNEFMEQEKERAAKREGVANNGENKSYVSYFALKNDGDEAIVRFAYTSPEGLGIYTTHAVTIDGKFRRVNCLRNWKDPIDNCPLCKAGNMPQRKLYVKMLEYVRNADGTITVAPRVWERPAGFIQELNTFFSEYGDLSNQVFKIKRNGKPRDPQTKYMIMPMPRDVYPENVYVKDFAALNEYDPLGKALLDKPFAEVVDIAKENPGDNVPTEAPKVVSNPFTSPSPVASPDPAVPTSVSSGGQKRVVY